MQLPSGRKFLRILAFGVSLLAIGIIVVIHLSSPEQKLPNFRPKAQEAAIQCGYIQLAPNGKGLICSNTGALFVPLGWKPIFPWHWESRQNPSPSLGNRTIESWVRDELAANGLNFINIWLNTNVGNGFSFEANVNEFNAAMDNGSGKMLFLRNLPLNATSTERAQRHNLLYGNPDIITDGSNISQLVEAAEKYGVKIKVSLFRQYEFRGDWEVNPYNKNRLTSEWWCTNSLSGYCLPGPATTVDEALSTYVQLQKDRFRFIYENWGESPAIAAWELMVEINQVTKNIGVDGVKRWVNEMSSYIRQMDTHHRPILLGSVTPEYRPWGSTANPALPQPDPNDPLSNNAKNTIFDTANIDIVSFHNYHFYNMWDRLIFHRLLEERYPGRTIQFGGGSGVIRAACPDDGYCIGLPPSVNGPDIPAYTHQSYSGEYEVEPWINSKIHAWLNLIASGGTGTASRFNAGEFNTNGFSSIYYAPSQFIKQVKWSRWNTSTMRAWEDWRDWGKWTNPDAISMIPWVAKTPQVENADFIAATGDSDQLMIMVRGSQNNVTLTIPNLEPGDYTAKVFDWMTGDIIQTKQLTVGSQPVNFSLSLDNGSLISQNACRDSRLGCYPGQDRLRLAMAYFEKNGASSPTPTPSAAPKQILVNWLTNILDQNADGKVDSLDFALIY